ncbi:E3 ubiquitin-protein ligase TRIM56 [Taenia solium]|eukprot:TsM_001045200 transcript=TsM_001045200 gene=TsM_001045200
MRLGTIISADVLNLHIPYTLPCEHTYCLEPCLIVRSNQTEVRCFRCKKLYPFNMAVRNAVLERRIARCFVEERQNLVATCTACQHPAPALCECQHCEVRICSACRDSHAAKVVTSVTKSTYVLLKKKKDLEETRNLLKIRPRIQATHLRNFIEQATLELEGACKRLLDRSTAKLNDLFDAHQAELNTSKGAICNMKEITRKYAQRKEFIPKMTLGPLLAMKKVLEGVATLSKCIYDGVDECEERFNLCVDYSLPWMVKSLSLIDTAGQDDR